MHVCLMRYSCLVVQSECFSIPGQDEKQQFGITQRAMKTLGFPDIEIGSIFQVVMAILGLGNLPIVSERDLAAINDKEKLQTVAETLQLNPAHLQVGTRYADPHHEECDVCVSLYIRYIGCCARR